MNVQITKIDDKLFTVDEIIDPSCWHLIIIQNGEGIMQLNSKIIALLPNRIFMIPILTHFDIYGVLRQGYLISFRPSYFKSFLNVGGAAHSTAVKDISSKDGHALYSLLEKSILKGVDLAAVIDLLELVNRGTAIERRDFIEKG